jgi:D-sedoheptulose 7-phosphate isomerase
MPPDVTHNPLDYLREVRRCLAELEKQDLSPVVEMLFRAYQANAQVYVMGNGGSASTATHMTAHLQEGWDSRGNGGLRAVCLADNISRFSALANDFAYDQVFTIQMQNLVRKSDVAILLSGSGNSSNILKAAEMARGIGAGVVTFTGFGGGKLSKLADCGVVLSSHYYGPVEDVHLTIGHLVPQMLRARIQNAQSRRVP